MGVCKSGLSSTQKLNSTETLLADTTRVNTTFSQWVSFNLVSALQFTVQMSKLNGLGKTYWKRICSRAENFTHPFTTNKREFTEYIDLAKPKSRASVSLFSGPSIYKKSSAVVVKEVIEGDQLGWGMEENWGLNWGMMFSQLNKVTSICASQRYFQADEDLCRYSWCFEQIFEDRESFLLQM